MWKNIDEKIISIKSYCLSSKITKGKILGQKNKIKTFGFIEIESESGKKGFSENYASVYITELTIPVVNYLQNYIVGKKISDLNILNDVSKIPIISRNGLIKSIIGSIEVAIWDLRGKILDKPVYELLNKKKSKVKCYASGGSVSMTEDQIEQEINEILKKQFKAYKMRVGLENWSKDLKRVSRARSKLSGNGLMIDAIMGTINPGWNLKEAKKKIVDLEKFEPIWLEEPLHPLEIKNYVKLRNKKVPIAAGEAYSSDLEFDYLIDNKSVDVLQFDCTHSGGIEICRNIAKKSKIKKIKNSIHVWGSPLALSSNLHLALSLESLLFFEIPQIEFDISNYMETKQIILSNGYVSLDDTPGFGIEINKNIKEKFKFVKGTEFNLKK
jgi:L-alanine-DL-glutamate epimerase-like enolase superfamily enzyme